MMMPEKAGGRAQAIGQHRKLFSAETAEDSRNGDAERSNEYTEYSVPKNFSVDAEFHCSQSQTCCKNGNTGIGVGNQVKGRIDRDRKLDP